MAGNTLIALSLLGLGSLASATQATCGRASYDTTQSVCYNSTYLCPIIAGTPLQFCAGSCYNSFMYTCTNNVVTLLPALPAGTAFTLTTSNPSLDCDGWPINADNGGFIIGGTTTSSCPVTPKSMCPPGNVTALLATSDPCSFQLNSEVSGGQTVYMEGQFHDISYTLAGSPAVPSSGVSTGFAAYKSGGFFNLNTGILGWVACPPTAAGGGAGAWLLLANPGQADTSVDLAICSPVNLKVTVIGAGYSAWEYT